MAGSYLGGSHASAIDALFVEQLPGIVETLALSSDLRSLPRGPITNFPGKEIVKTLRVGLNGAITYGSDNSAIPPPGAQRYAQTKISKAYGFGSVGVSDGLAAAVRKGKMVAAKNLVSEEMTGVLNTFKLLDDLMLCRDGTGKIATLGVTVSGTTITVSDGRAFWPGCDFEIRQAGAETVIRGSGRVKSVARALTAAGEASVTLDAAFPVGAALGDPIFFGAGLYSTYGKCINGLDIMIDDSTATFQGVTVADYPWWTSPVLDGGGLSQVVHQDLFRSLMAMLKQENPDYELPGGLVWYTTTWDGINIDKLFEGAMHVTPDSSAVGMKGGLRIRNTFGECTIKVNKFMPLGKVFAVNRVAINRPVVRELDWRRNGDATGEGGPIFQLQQGQLNSLASFSEIHQLAILERNTCGKIENLKVTPGSAY